MIQLTDRHKKLLKWVGYPLLGLLVFIFAIFWTFPYERLKDKIVEKVGEKYDITISEIEPTLIPGGVVLSAVSLQERPEEADQVPAMLFFEEVEIDIGLFGLLFGSLDLEVAAETASGSLEARLTSDSLDFKEAKEVKLVASTNNLQLGSLPGVREGVGLPVAGGLTADLEIALPEMKFSKAKGFLRFKCGGCTIGDGEAKIKPKLPPSKRNNPRYKRRLAMYGDGITVPKLALGAAEAEVVIEDGVGTIEKMSAVSGDGELSLDGEIRFADPFKKSTLPGCLRFKLTEDLKKREKDFGNIDLILDAKRGDDGFFAFPTMGTLTHLRWSTRKECAADGVGAAKTKRPRIRRRRATRSRNRRSTIGARTPAARKAAGKDADEPEVKGVGASGPKIDKRGDERRGRDERGDDARDERGDDARDDRGDDARDDRGDDARGDDLGDDLGEEPLDEEFDDRGEEAGEEPLDEEPTDEAYVE